MGRPKVIVLEGPRMTGKSRVAKYLRNNINYATLINCTGFPERGEKGFNKIFHYYAAWLAFLRTHQDSDITLIFDRHMFSELVFARLYKDYEFDSAFTWMLHDMVDIADVELYIMEMDNEEELKRRLSSRKKVNYAEVQENLTELLKQRKGYLEMYDELIAKDLTGLNVHHINMNDKESIEVAKHIVYEYNKDKEEKGC